jgi:hypothetical protein
MDTAKGSKLNNTWDYFNGSFTGCLKTFSAGG